MKLRIFILGICLTLSVAARAQQTISMTKTNASLKEIFNDINTQTGYEFVYSSEVLETEAKLVTLSLKNATLEEVLKLCFKEQPLTWSIKDKIIIVRKKETPADDPGKKKERTEITGTILDKAGVPIPGVSILIKGTNTGTTSDADGKYMIEANDDDIIVFTFIGYKKIETKVSDRILIDLTMEEEVSQLDEVRINAGYYSVTDEERTGSIARIGSKEIQNNPVTNPLQAMQGRMAGVYIVQNGGTPGNSFEVQIRGINSIANGNQPLYIIDGVPFLTDGWKSSYEGATYLGSSAETRHESPLNSINPNDIESIEVLKDADATAIYGSRGANGVVLITTKKGKAGALKVDLNLKSGVSVVTKRVDLLNRRDYIAMRMEAVNNDGSASPGDTEYDINGTWDQNRYTDWQEVILGNTAKMTDLNLALSGGSEGTQFLFGAGYNTQGTVMPGDNIAQRLSSHFSVTHTSANKRFNASFSSTFSKNNSDLFINDLTGSMYMPPNAPAPYKNGEINWEVTPTGVVTWDNPFASLIDRRISKIQNLITNATLGFEILKGLKGKLNIGLNDNRNDIRRTFSSDAESPSSNVTPADSDLGITSANIQSWILEPQLDYSRKIGKGELSMLVGGTYQYRKSESISEKYTGFTTNALINDPRSAATSKVEGYNFSEYKYVAGYGRLNFNWDQKYIVNLTGRRDGSSRFGPGRKFAAFGAVGFAWIFSNEGFIKNAIPFLSFGKIRSSFGTTGNDQIGDYRYLDLYQSGSSAYQGITALGLTQVFNPDYRWEVNSKLEGAINLGFLKDRLMFGVAWYRNLSSNQLIEYNLARITGYSSVLQNSPATVENKGLELEINTVNINRGSFKWTTSVNITFPKNTLLAFPNLESSSYANFYMIGKSLNIRRVLHFTGVNPVTGLYDFEDVNDDGQLTDLDRKSVIDYSQHYFGGISNDISYKGLQIGILFQFVRRTGEVFTSYSTPGYATSIYGNQPSEIVDDRWQNSGDDATVQRFSRKLEAVTAQDRYDNSNAVAGEIFYMRLKNVSISYQLPDNIMERVKCRIMLQGQNLLTITKFPGLDPESGSRHTPPLTTIIGGIQLTF